MRLDAVRRVIGAALALWVCSAAQSAVLCGDPTSQISTSDLSFGNSPSATACYGLVSGTPTAAGLGFDSRTGFTDFSLVVGGLLPTSPSSPATGNGDFQGIGFDLQVTESNSGGDRGNWSLAWSGVGLPATLDIVAVIQTSLGSWGSYLFSDLLFSAPGSGAGSWTINLLDPVSEGFASLTGFWLYARGPVALPPPPTGSVGEPPGLLLAMTAIFVFGLVAWRASAKRRTQSVASNVSR